MSVLEVFSHCGDVKQIVAVNKTFPEKDIDHLYINGFNRRFFTLN